MALPSGLSTQLGVKTETTHGTAVTVDRFYEYNTESVKLDIARMESQGLRSGTLTQRSDRWVAGAKQVSGSVEMEVMNKSMGLLLGHAIGAAVLSQPAAGPDPTVWDQTFAPIDLPVGFTLQLGRTDTGGTTRAFTYSGCKIPSWELMATVGEIGKLKFDVDGQDETTATALASVSYPATLTPLTCIEATLTLAGSAIACSSVSLTGDNGLKGDRRKLGSALRLTPLQAGKRTYGGSIDAEFVDLTQYNRFVNGTEAALVFKFEGATISNDKKYSLTATANVRFDGATPNVGGPDEIRQPLNFKCVGNTDATALTVVYRSTDTAS